MGRAVAVSDWAGVQAMRMGGHIATVAVLFAAFLAFPAWQGGVSLSAILARNDSAANTVSVGGKEAAAATYTILVNRDLHPDGEELARWVDFLEGKESALPQGRVTCMTCTNDDAGATLAQEFAARLSPNQMTLHDDVAVLILSKVEAGKFDIVVMSDEAAEAVGAYTAYDLPFVEVIHR